MRRRSTPRAAAAAAAAALVITTTLSLAATVPAPAPASVPQLPTERVGRLAAAPGGDLWFTLDASFVSGVLHPDGTTRTWTIPRPVQLEDDQPPLAADPAGAAWLAVTPPGGGGRDVLRLDARAAEPRRVAHTTDPVWELAATPEGLWWTGPLGLTLLPTGGAPRLVAPGSVSSLTPAPAGGVWIHRSRPARDGTLPAGEVERWTAAGRQAASPVPWSTDLLADDGRGGLWMLSETFGYDAVERLDTATGARGSVACPVCAAPRSLLPAPAGGVYVRASDGEDGSVVAHVPAAGGGAPRVLERRAHDGGAPSSGALAVRADDGTLAIGRGAPARLTLLDPATGAARDVRLDVPRDTVPPRLALRPIDVREGRVRVPFTCGEPCMATATVTLTERERRRLRLTRGEASVAYDAAPGAPGERATVAARLAAPVRRALRHRAVRARVRLTASDVAHNTVTVTRTVTLRR